MVLGSYAKHPGLTFRAKRILARHTALVRYQGLALGADTFPTASHGALLFMSGHSLDFLLLSSSSLLPLDSLDDEQGQLNGFYAFPASLICASYFC